MYLRTNVELRKLSPDDGNDIYELLQLIPKDENGLINKANGLSFEEYKQWLINKQIESEQKGLVDGRFLQLHTGFMLIMCLLVLVVFENF